MKNLSVLEQEVELAQSGDREAFTRLIKANEASMYRIASAILQSDSERLDAAQEAVMKAYLSLHTLRNPKYFKTWLIRILINECRRITRQNNKVVVIHDMKEQASSHRFEETVELEDAINGLEEELRLCVTLHYLEDLPVKEVAGVLNHPEGTIKSRLSRARKKLAAILSPDSSDRRAGYE